VLLLNVKSLSKLLTETSIESYRSLLDAGCNVTVIVTHSVNN